MYGKALILVLCVAAGLAKDIKSVCASQTSNQLWPHEKNCNQFYQCSNQVPVSQTCAPGTNFNEKIQACDWPANVNCNRTVTVEEDVNYEAEAATRCTVKTSEGLQLAHRNCSRFYKCSRGVPYPLDCPANLLYNIKLQVCDWPEAVSCGNRITSNKSDQNSADDPKEVCAAKGSEGLLLPHKKCNYFYECTHGAAALLSCPDGLLFDIKNEQCEWPKDVNCGNRSTETGVNRSEFESDAVKACAADSSEGLLLPHENCNKFYECAHKLPVVFDCFPGLLFSTEANRCDWADNVDCGERKPLNPQKEDTAPAETSKPKDEVKDLHSDAVAACTVVNSSGELLAHENCYQFYECANSRPVTLDCPEGLLYNIEAKRCDWAENVNCGDRNPHSKAHQKKSAVKKDFNSSAIEVCKANGSDSLLLPHDNCYQFYECAQGTPVVFDCYPGLLFNSATNQCDWSENVDCGDRAPQPENKRSKAEAGNKDENGYNSTKAACALDDSEGLLLPHEDCNKFYECAKGRAVTLECPDGLMFNIESQCCDWAAEVDCGDRTQQKKTETCLQQILLRATGKG